MTAKINVSMSARQGLNMYPPQQVRIRSTTAANATTSVPFISTIITITVTVITIKTTTIVTIITIIITITITKVVIEVVVVVVSA